MIHIQTMYTSCTFFSLNPVPNLLLNDVTTQESQTTQIYIIATTSDIHISTPIYNNMFILHLKMCFQWYEDLIYIIMYQSYWMYKKHFYVIGKIWPIIMFLFFCLFIQGCLNKHTIFVNVNTCIPIVKYNEINDLQYVCYYCILE